MRKLLFFVFTCSGFLSASAQSTSTRNTSTPDSIAVHPVVLDGDKKLISWLGSPDVAFGKMLRLRWDFVKHHAPMSPGPAPRSDYPQYYFYCAFRDSGKGLQPDLWMNDVGEKIPNWFESARLYYAYSGDVSPMKIVREMVDYTLDHGTSPSSFAWPLFPYTTTNAGDTDFRGFTSAKRFVLHEIQVDHAADMGLTYFRMFQFTGEARYQEAAIHVADVLASKVRTGNAEQSPWPYRVNMETGQSTSEYGANWSGAYLLMDNLIRQEVGNTGAYKRARRLVRDFLVEYPLNTGYWTDGHSDTDVKSHTYRSNMSKSNFTLTLFDHPELDQDWKFHIPQLIQWTEEYFVFRTAPGEPASQWGANLVGEQDDFNFKMDYQTARYAAECARWYAFSGDPAYKEKAYRAMNWVTYCMDAEGKVFESPVSKGILSWWSDSYGEGPRMVYPLLASVPEWAPIHENHILYSEGIVTDVVYSSHGIDYTTSEDEGTEFLKVNFEPKVVTVSGSRLSPATRGNGYIVKSLGNGDFAVTIKRKKAGKVMVR